MEFRLGYEVERTRLWIEKQCFVKIQKEIKKENKNFSYIESVDFTLSKVQ
ncbi:hypothetical protein JCM31826_02750 [Thermaurantimonas aggregans]|uniref:Uncharacterized protein n=1 Tax=Thermaurantimonas aggregans TaxID=2173829 RepID=A0A401XIH3_9FLAO|nr:hypothetical protein JCM31826_02750 [Thermaurantimonas aggregans]